MVYLSDKKERILKGLTVLYEDETCLVIDKPPGLAVQGGVGVNRSLDMLLQRSRPGDKPLLVHRLDRDTSGLILVAKGPESAARFARMIQQKEARKIYLALVSGIPKPDAGLITTPLEIQGKIKSAETRYRVIESHEARIPSGGVFSLLEIELGSGRMHQIRRHLAQKHWPILGDDKYGDFALNKILRKAPPAGLGLKRLMLHASRLVIPGYAPGLDLSAPLPDCFARCQA
jgi:23S rRNA pseudouridine955/2504/2580 synthase